MAPAGPPPHRIRALDPAGDLPAVADLYARAADYVLLESGRPPDAATASAFFTDRAPGIGPDRAHKLGLFLDDGRLAAIADLCFGFPEPEDAYLGLLLIDRDLRGQGLGAAFLDHLTVFARRRGVPRLLLAVLDANPRGRAFWERQGFRVVLTTPPTRMGDAVHIRHRMERRFGPTSS